MEVFLIMPTSPEDRAKLSYELNKFHAEQALKMVQKLPWSTEQKLALIDAVDLATVRCLVITGAGAKSFAASSPTGSALMSSMHIVG